MTMTRLARVWVIPAMLLVLCAACGDGGAPAENPQHVRLHALFGEAWEFGLQENPLFATSAGDSRFDDRLPEVSLAAVERRMAFWQDLQQRLQDIDVDALDPVDRVSFQVFEKEVQDNIRSLEYRQYLLPFNADSGFHTALPQLPREMPFQSVEGYENYLARLEALPEYMGQQIDMLRLALSEGVTVPRAVLDGYEGTMSLHLVDDPHESVFWAPLESFPPAVPESARAGLQARAETAISESVVPAYKALLDFFVDEYLPGARQTLAASELPNGEAYYGELVRQFTTLDVTPQEVHEIGLSEVARIRGEMDAVIEEVGWTGDYASFLDFLRTDPRFYPETAEELLQYAAYLSKKIDGKLPSLFKTMPRLPYGVEPVPDHLAPKYTTGRYVGATPGSTEPGIYWVNTYNLPSRTLYTLPALTLHEAVPGHHFQIALAQELEGLPQFRRFLYVDAFGEGWGLYSEFLGEEVGMYEDPYDRFGRLTYEMWRACRLVVDTGVHAMGWTREQALEYMGSNTALSLHEVGTEIDRYISWPGQALAYKMGELKIRELRLRAEQALGERFDVRDFHDVVLQNGSIPLSVLEAEVDRYIAGMGPH